MGVAALCATVLLGTRQREESASIRAEYQRLAAAGCDPATFGIATPIEARILRNVPYAIASQRFESTDLRILYAGDGDWYRPNANSVTLAADSASCVSKISSHEALLRKQLPIDKTVEAMLTQDPRVFWQLRRSVHFPDR